MITTKDRLKEIAEQVKNNEPPEPITVRTLISWFGAQRRGWSVTFHIQKTLERLGIWTRPDFRYAYIDSVIEFILFEPKTSSEIKHNQNKENENDNEDLAHSIIEMNIGGAVDDPTYRIGKLESANLKDRLVWIKPNDSLDKAITVMMQGDFSQIPVMQSERVLKGVVTWASICQRWHFGNKNETAADYMEKAVELSVDDSLFAAIPIIVDKGYVLIRDETNCYVGVVTTSDLSLQFKQLSEPFLLIGEIENHIRRLIDGKFTADELIAVRDSSDTNREINNVGDLTFGEYIWLLQNPENWKKLNLPIDRISFIAELDRIRNIRNDVMHFNPDPLGDDDINLLRKSVIFLQRLKEITDKK